MINYEKEFGHGTITCDNCSTSEDGSYDDFKELVKYLAGSSNNWLTIFRKNEAGFYHACCGACFKQLKQKEKLTNG